MRGVVLGMPNGLFLGPKGHLVCGWGLTAKVGDLHSPHIASEPGSPRPLPNKR